MAYSVLITGEVAARNVDALRKIGKATFDLENGHVVVLGDVSTAKDENYVHTVDVPSTDTLATGVFYMVDEPVNVLVAGKYSGLSDDPMEFYIPTGKVFTMYKPQIGDEIIITANGLAGVKGDNIYVAPADGTTKLTWTNDISGVALAYKCVGNTYVSCGNERVAAYRFVCVKA